MILVRLRKGSAMKKRRIIGYIYRPWITRPDGTRDWAINHGRKAWKIPVYGD